MAASGKIWFITGISRGFGKAIAEQALLRGDRVLGTTRDGKSDIAADSASLRVFPLDVSRREEVFSRVAEARAVHGRIDVVVNNAGYGLLGAVEECAPEEIQSVFDVNFWGTLHVTQAVLPFLRSQGSGHIVNITSIAGLAPGAASGLYAASKFAVEGMSHSLALEVAPLGIRVTVVEPGAFRTDFLHASSIRHAAVKIADYDATSGETLRRLAKMAGQQIGDPVRGAQAILKAVDAAEPPRHLVIGSDALSRTRAQVEALTRDLDTWQETSLSTDYESSAGAGRQA